LGRSWGRRHRCRHWIEFGKSFPQLENMTCGHPNITHVALLHVVYNFHAIESVLQEEAHITIET
jgi:hypothetical protein